MKDDKVVAVAAPKDAALTAPLKASCHRVLVIGASSYLGSALATGLRDQMEVFGTYHENFGRIDGVTMIQLDVLNAGAILDVLRRIEPDVVFYCAGPSDPEDTETNQADVDSLLLKAPSLFFKIPVKPFHFIYFSSEQVMSDHAGDVAPFTENSATRPVNKFGQLKAQAEALIRSQGRLTHIFRIGTLFGETAGGGPRFRYGFYESFVRLIDQGKALHLADDRRRSFLYIGELVRAARAFLAKLPEESSIYNIAPPDSMSYFELGQAFVSACKWPHVELIPFSAASNATAVPQPLNSTLNSALFTEKFEFRFAKVRDAVTEMAERLHRGQTQPWT